MDADATDALGHSLAEALRQHLEAIRVAGLQLNLVGDLGAGKTSLVRAMLRALGVGGPVKSPTFALLEPYTVSSLDFYHFDFYRLKDPAEFGNAGFRDLFGPGRICVVEWPERAGPRLPTANISITLTVDGDGRMASISTTSELGEACLSSAIKEMQAVAGGSSPPAPARSSSR
ncbi:MAG: tRNA (adenosine(37)-N6)-threonylcarbamoyltransferase complex ATPase subunit type 1 TsaE [Burkholderiaceae bacterium]|nr:tRNA (adenosine(37)-N6)-threonylcarbamoyltransferase complex ATPase subunit type 1 TsaE [Burkholderiaceae bacterium]